MKMHLIICCVSVGIKLNTNIIIFYIFILFYSFLNSNKNKEKHCQLIHLLLKTPQMYDVQETQSFNESIDEIVIKVSSTILVHSSTNL